jgi:hypothetical protein
MNPRGGKGNPASNSNATPIGGAGGTGGTGGTGVIKGKRIGGIGFNSSSVKREEESEIVTEKPKASGPPKMSTPQSMVTARKDAMKRSFTSSFRSGGNL